MKIAPAMPLINTSGTNTATVVSDELSIGVIISVVPATAARFRESPRSRYCVTFSRYNNRIVNHHSHRQNQARQRNHIQRNLTNIKKEKSNHHRSHHRDTNNQRRTDISDKKHGNNKNKQKSQRKVLLKIEIV